jgi:hypothetical protein
MAIRRIFIIIPMILCLMAVLVIGLFLFQTIHQPKQSVVCPDGSVVELVGVTFGKVHHNPITGPWTRLLQIVPPSLQQRFGIRTPNLRQTKTETLMIWLQWKGRSSDWNGRKMIVDTDGYASELSHWGNRGNKITANGKIHWAGFEVDIYPRRSPFFKLRLENWNQNIEAELVIQNPMISKAKPFEGNHLPSSFEIDNMQFTMIGLELPDPENPPKRPEKRFGSHDARATFQVHQDGEITEDWQAVNIWLEDGMGNRAKNHSWSNREKDGKVTITFDSGLFPGEAWKVRTQFARKQNFLPEDIWSVEIPLPNAPDYRTNLVSRVMHERTVKVQGIADQNGLLLDGSKADSYSRRNPKEHTFEIRVDDMPEELRLDLFEVVDNHGRTIKTGGKSWGGGHYRYDVELEDDATHLKVKLAVHQSKFADYIAEPSIVSEETAEP